MLASDCTPPARPRRLARSAGPLAAALLPLLLLTGCLGYDGDLTVSTDDTVSGTITVSKTVPTTPSGGLVSPSIANPVPIPIPQPPQQSAEASTPSADPSALDLPTPKPAVDTIAVAPYQSGQSVGYTYTYTDATFADAAGFAPLADRGGALMFSREGDTVTLTAQFDLSYGSGTPAQEEIVTKNFDGTVALVFPAAPTETNGTVDGRTVTWKLIALEQNTLTATVVYPGTSGDPAATSAATEASGEPVAAASENLLTKPVLGVPLWVLLVGGVVVLVLVAVLVSIVRGRRRDAPAHDGSAPVGSDLAGSDEDGSDRDGSDEDGSESDWVLNPSDRPGRAIGPTSDRHPSDPHPSDPQPSEPHPSDRHPSEPHPSDRHPSDQHPSDRHTSDPHPSDGSETTVLARPGGTGDRLPPVPPPPVPTQTPAEAGQRESGPVPSWAPAPPPEDSAGTRPAFGVMPPREPPTVTEQDAPPEPPAAEPVAMTEGLPADAAQPPTDTPQERERDLRPAPATAPPTPTPTPTARAWAPLPGTQPWTPSPVPTPPVPALPVQPVAPETVGTPAEQTSGTLAVPIEQTPPLIPASEPPVEPDPPGVTDRQPDVETAPTDPEPVGSVPAPAVAEQRPAPTIGSGLTIAGWPPPRPQWVRPEDF